MQGRSTDFPGTRNSALMRNCRGVPLYFRVCLAGARSHQCHWSISRASTFLTGVTWHLARNFLTLCYKVLGNTPTHFSMLIINLNRVTVYRQEVHFKFSFLGTDEEWRMQVNGNEKQLIVVIVSNWQTACLWNTIALALNAGSNICYLYTYTQVI